MGFHSIMTTTHPPKSNFLLQGSKVPFGCLPVRSLSPGGTRPNTTWSGTLHKNWCQVWGVASSAISINSHQQINLHYPASSGWPPEQHITSTSPRHARNPFDQEGPRSGSYPQQTDCIELAAIGKSSAQHPTSSHMG
jgi:hypothetical protein